jgi:hypothetical protein
MPYRLLIFSHQLVSGERPQHVPTRNTELKRFQWLTRLSRLSFPSINPKKAKTGAQRARAYRQRKRQKAKAVASPNHESPSSESLIPEDFSSADSAFAEPPFTPPPTVTLRAVEPDEDAPSRSISRILLVAAAITLAAVGIAMNGWFARSLGSSDAAGWLFLAIGVAADLVALVAPSCAARLWQARHRATSLAGWAVWAVTFVFAVSALAAGGAVCLACGAGRRRIMGGDTRFIRNEKPAKVAIDVVRWKICGERIDDDSRCARSRLERAPAVATLPFDDRLGTKLRNRDVR